MATLTGTEKDERLEILARAKVVQDELDAEAGRVAGVTFNQAVVLARVQASGDLATVSLLAAGMNRAVHTLTSTINGLERKGMVHRRQVSGDDRRIVRIALQQDGREALARLSGTNLPIWHD